MKSTTPATAPVTRHPILSVRRAGVPLVAFETSDPAQTMVQTTKALNGNAASVALMRWDICKGLVGVNTKGQNAVTSILSNKEVNEGAGQEATVEPGFCLNLLRKYAEYETAQLARNPRAPKVIDSAIIFFLNGHLYTKNETVLQALWNLRDALKPTAATLIMLCPEMRLPAELAHDVVVVTEPLPTIAEVGTIVDNLVRDAKVDASGVDRAKVVDVLLGISAFAAEQVLALSTYPDAAGGTAVIHMDELWDRKRKMVEQTPGLSVFRGSESFDDIGGLDNIKLFLTKILKSGNNPVRCIGFIDEIEKMFSSASTGGDLSGVAQDQLKVFLTEMQDNEIPGLILIGPPGTGKSAIAKGAGAVAGAEVLTIDTGAMTGSLVGESQAKIRHAMATFKAVSQKKGLFIATCNKIGALPPELRRRFTLGTFYVDLPTDAERKAIWPIWLKKYSEKPGSHVELTDERPPDEGWTGAEIKACCDVAFRADISLAEAADFIVPVSLSAADQIKQLRTMASDKFISASKKGVYHYDASAVENAPLPPERATRRFRDNEGDK